MLVVHVKEGEFVRFRHQGQEFWIQCHRHSASWTKLAIDAPRSVDVRRCRAKWGEPVEQRSTSC